MSSEATTTTHISWDGTRTPLKTALFLVVCITWLLPGLIGHDPWKYDEAVVFGVVSDILRTGDWISFRIAEEPFFGKAPLFVWTAALLGKLLGGIMPLHDAARLAAGVYVAAVVGRGSALCMYIRAFSVFTRRRRAGSMRGVGRGRRSRCVASREEEDSEHRHGSRRNHRRSRHGETSVKVILSSASANH